MAMRSSAIGNEGSIAAGSVSADAVTGQMPALSGAVLTFLRTHTG